jgi:tetratricopeptide (TPR) repeat protein
MRFWITILAVFTLLPRAAQARSSEPLVRAALVALRLNDPDRSERKLYRAIQRARRTGKYASLAAEIRDKPVYRELLTSPRNAYMLDLFDAEAAGTITLSEVKERLRDPEALRDALANTVPRAYVEAMRPPDRPLCDPSARCTALHIDRTVENGHRAFDEGRYYEAAGLYGLAIQLTGKGNALARDNRLLALSRRGVSLRVLGLLDQSLRTLRAAEREFPRNSMVHYELAATYSRLGKTRRAEKHLKKCLALAEREGTAEQALSAMLRDPGSRGTRGDRGASA